MLAVTHLVVSFLLIYVMSLDRNDAFIALMFGAFIDIDHLFGLKAYVDVHGVTSVLDFDALTSADGQWKSLLHSPVAVMVVGPVATASRLAVPLVFWGVHISMDFVEDAYLGLFSAWEMALLLGSTAALLFLGFRKARVSEPEVSFAGFLSRQWSSAVSPFRRLRRAVFGPLGL
ncbi:MAG: hypothetical protein QG582_1181 [Candidatus Thermoplasmatota archaeon]|nr:hypothetical protein [Candidatus Thermoplasmatota archaeon]